MDYFFNKKTEQEQNNVIYIENTPLRIDCLIGEGNYGYVFRAVSPTFNGDKYFALKRINAASEDSCREAETEIDVLKNIPSSTNTLYYFGSKINQKPDTTEYNILTEYCEGGPLTRYLVLEHLLPEAVVERVTIATAKALAHFHRSGYIHRDVKDCNILVRPDLPKSIFLIEKDFVLGDYGSAIRGFSFDFKDLSIKTDFERNTTPSFRAPELVDVFSSRHIDNKIDTWALGVMILRLLTGKNPFEESQSKIIRGEYEMPEVGEKLSKVIKGCLEVDPEKRLSAVDIVEILSGTVDEQFKTMTPEAKILERKQSVTKNAFDIFGCEAAKPAPPSKPETAWKDIF